MARRIEDSEDKQQKIHDKHARLASSATKGISNDILPKQLVRLLSSRAYRRPMTEETPSAQRARILELQRLAVERKELEAQLAEVKLLMRAATAGKICWNATAGKPETDPKKRRLKRVPRAKKKRRRSMTPHPTTSQSLSPVNDPRSTTRRGAYKTRIKRRRMRSASEHGKSDIRVVASAGTDRGTTPSSRVMFSDHIGRDRPATKGTMGPSGLGEGRRKTLSGPKTKRPKSAPHKSPATRSRLPTSRVAVSGSASPVTTLTTNHTTRRREVDSESGRKDSFPDHLPRRIKDDQQQEMTESGERFIAVTAGKSKRWPLGQEPAAPYERTFPSPSSQAGRRKPARVNRKEEEKITGPPRGLPGERLSSKEPGDTQTSPARERWPEILRDIPDQRYEDDFEVVSPHFSYESDFDTWDGGSGQERRTGEDENSQGTRRHETGYSKKKRVPASWSCDSESFDSLSDGDLRDENDMPIKRNETRNGVPSGNDAALLETSASKWGHWNRSVHRNSAAIDEGWRDIRQATSDESGSSFEHLWRGHDDDECDGGGSSGGNINQDWTQTSPVGAVDDERGKNGPHRSADGEPNDKLNTTNTDAQRGHVGRQDSKSTASLSDGGSSLYDVLLSSHSSCSDSTWSLESRGLRRTANRSAFTDTRRKAASVRDGGTEQKMPDNPLHGRTDRTGSRKGGYSTLSLAARTSSDGSSLYDEISNNSAANGLNTTVHRTSEPPLGLSHDDEADAGTPVREEMAKSSHSGTVKRLSPSVQRLSRTQEVDYGWHRGVADKASPEDINSKANRPAGGVLLENDKLAAVERKARSNDAEQTRMRTHDETGHIGSSDAVFQDDPSVQKSHGFALSSFNGSVPNSRPVSGHGHMTAGDGQGHASGDDLKVESGFIQKGELDIRVGSFDELSLDRAEQFHTQLPNDKRLVAENVPPYERMHDAEAAPIDYSENRTSGSAKVEGFRHTRNGEELPTPDFSEHTVFDHAGPSPANIREGKTASRKDVGEVQEARISQVGGFGGVVEDEVEYNEPFDEVSLYDRERSPTQKQDSSPGAAEQSRGEGSVNGPVRPNMEQLSANDRDSLHDAASFVNQRSSVLVREKNTHSNTGDGAGRTGGDGCGHEYHHFGGSSIDFEPEQGASSPRQRGNRRPDGSDNNRRTYDVHGSFRHSAVHNARMGSDIHFNGGQGLVSANVPSPAPSRPTRSVRDKVISVKANPDREKKGTGDTGQVEVITLSDSGAVNPTPEYCSLDEDRIQWKVGIVRTAAARGEGSEPLIKGRESSLNEVFGGEEKASHDVDRGRVDKDGETKTALSLDGTLSLGRAWKPQRGDMIDVADAVDVGTDLSVADTVAAGAILSMRNGGLSRSEYGGMGNERSDDAGIQKGVLGVEVSHCDAVGGGPSVEGGGSSLDEYYGQQAIDDPYRHDTLKKNEVETRNLPGTSDSQEGVDVSGSALLDHGPIAFVPPAEGVSSLDAYLYAGGGDARYEALGKEMNESRRGAEGFLDESRSPGHDGYQQLPKAATAPTVNTGNDEPSAAGGRMSLDDYYDGQEYGTAHTDLGGISNKSAPKAESSLGDESYSFAEDHEQLLAEAATASATGAADGERSAKREKSSSHASNDGVEVDAQHASRDEFVEGREVEAQESLDELYSLSEDGELVNEEAAVSTAGAGAGAGAGADTGTGAGAANVMSVEDGKSVKESFELIEVVTSTEAIEDSELEADVDLDRLYLLSEKREQVLEEGTVTTDTATVAATVDGTDATAYAGDDRVLKSELLMVKDVSSSNVNFDRRRDERGDNSLGTAIGGSDLAIEKFVHSLHSSDEDRKQRHQECTSADAGNGDTDDACPPAEGQESSKDNGFDRKKKYPENAHQNDVITNTRIGKGTSFSPGEVKNRLLHGVSPIAGAGEGGGGPLVEGGSSLDEYVGPIEEINHYSSGGVVNGSEPEAEDTLHELQPLGREQSQPLRSSTIVVDAISNAPSVDGISSLDKNYEPEEDRMYHASSAVFIHERKPDAEGSFDELHPPAGDRKPLQDSASAVDIVRNVPSVYGARSSLDKFSNPQGESTLYSSSGRVDDGNKPEAEDSLDELHPAAEDRKQPLQDGAPMDAVGIVGDGLSIEGGESSLDEYLYIAPEKENAHYARMGLIIHSTPEAQDSVIGSRSIFYSRDQKRPEAATHTALGDIVDRPHVERGGSSFDVSPRPGMNVTTSTDRGVISNGRPPDAWHSFQSEAIALAEDHEHLRGAVSPTPAIGAAEIRPHATGAGIPIGVYNEGDKEVTGYADRDEILGKSELEAEESLDELYALDEVQEQVQRGATMAAGTSAGATGRTSLDEGGSSLDEYLDHAELGSEVIKDCDPRVEGVFDELHPLGQGREGLRDESARAVIAGTNGDLPRQGERASSSDEYVNRPEAHVEFLGQGSAMRESSLEAVNSLNALYSGAKEQRRSQLGGSTTFAVRSGVSDGTAASSTGLQFPISTEKLPLERTLKGLRMQADIRGPTRDSADVGPAARASIDDVVTRHEPAHVVSSDGSRGSQNLSTSKDGTFESVLFEGEGGSLDEYLFDGLASEEQSSDDRISTDINDSLFGGDASAGSQDSFGFDLC